MMPFDWMVTTRLQQKDQYRPCIPVPINSTTLLPAPAAYDNPNKYEGLQTGVLSDINAALQRAVVSYPRGEDHLPAAPSALYGIQAAPVNPPSTGYTKHNYAALA